MKFVGRIYLIGICLGTIIFFVQLFIQNMYEGYVNGRGYHLKKTCIKSHIENGTRPQLMGKVWIQMPTNYEVCDKYKTDTIWETK